MNTFFKNDVSWEIKQNYELYFCFEFKHENTCIQSYLLQRYL